MTRTLSLFAAALLAACSAAQTPEPQTAPAATADTATQPPAAPAAEPAATPVAQPAAAPAEDAEAKAKAEQAVEDAERWAKMEAKAKEESARWTAELRAASKGLSEKKYWSLKAALPPLLRSKHRAPGNADRDVQRHPAETLTFMGVKPNMTVFEYGPGAGWYTELLAPLLATRGKLIVNNGDPNGSRENRGTYYAKRFQMFVDKAPGVYGKIETATITDSKAPKLGLSASVDMALVIRGAHGWVRREATRAWLSQIHRALKGGGRPGHRAASRGRRDRSEGGGIQGPAAPGLADLGGGAGRLQADRQVGDQREPQGRGELPGGRVDLAALADAGGCGSGEVPGDRRERSHDAEVQEGRAGQELGAP